MISISLSTSTAQRKLSPQTQITSMSLSAPTTWSRVNDVLSNVNSEVASAEQPSVAERTLRSLSLLREADPSLIPDVVVSGHDQESKRKLTLPSQLSFKSITTATTNHQGI
jgi:hypothetical protein